MIRIFTFCLLLGIAGAGVRADNLIPFDGFCAVGREAPLRGQKVPPKCRLSVRPGSYGAGNAVYVAENDDRDYARLETKTFAVCGDLMVFEVMARSTGGAQLFDVIAVADRYKLIAHKHYRLTRDWRKYVAIVEVPPVQPPRKRDFVGLIDVKGGVHMEIGRVSVYPAANDVRIAGMADDLETEGASAKFEPTLADAPGPAPSSTAFVCSQKGNTHPIVVLKTRRSDEIVEDSVLGAALDTSLIGCCPPTGYYLSRWSPHWAIAGDEMRKGAMEPCFSTSPQKLAAKGLSLTVRLPNVVPLAKVRLTPRGKGLGGFPIDWHFDVSADGKTFETVRTVTNFQAAGTCPEIALGNRPLRALRLVADRLRPESKFTAYLQLERLEAFDAEGTNHALIGKGAVAETPAPMNVPILDRRSYLDEAVVDCGVKTVLCGVRPFGREDEMALENGFAIGSRCYENLTDNIRYLKSRGVKTYVRFSFGDKIMKLKTPEERAAFPALCVERILPFVKTWKGLVAGYPLAGEENQYRVQGKLTYDVAEYKRVYREAVLAVSRAIHAVDPAAQTSVTTALFDFGWTEEHLKNGLAQELDEISVDIYREGDPMGSYPEKCYSFFVDGRRGLESERLFTRAEDELKAFRKLLDKYNPKLRFSAHETCMTVGAYPHGMTSTAEGQAKFAARTYVMHHFYGIGPTCWWSYNSGPAGGNRQWGVLQCGKRLPGWYALRTFAALFDASWKPDAEKPLVFTPADERYYSYSFRRGQERLYAFWASVSMRDANTGKVADVFVPGDFGEGPLAVDCVDMLSGGVWQADVKRVKGGFLAPGMIVRDYPLVLRVLEKRVDPQAVCNVNTAWRRLLTEFRSPVTGLLYEHCSDGDATHYLPTPAEIAKNEPIATGWNTGMEDSILNGCPALLAAMARNDRAAFDRLYPGLMRCATVSGKPGFLVRSISPADNRSFYWNSSRDQYTLFTYTMWRVAQSAFATAEMRREIATVIRDIAAYAEACVTSENGYELLRFDGKRGIVTQMWTATPKVEPKIVDIGYADFGGIMPHEAGRLPMFYAAAFALTGDRHWREQELKYADDAIRMAAYGMPEGSHGFALYQMQVSQRLLWECETDPVRKSRYLGLLRQTAKTAKGRQASAERILQELNGDLSAPVGDWRAWPRRQRVLGDGFLNGLPYFSPIRPKAYDRAYECVRESSEGLLVRLLCPGFELEADEIVRFERFLKTSGFERGNFSGIVYPVLVKALLMKSDRRSR